MNIRFGFPAIAAAAIVALLLASCAEMFQPKVALRQDDNPGVLDTLFTAPTQGGSDKLAVPGQFYIAPRYASSEIRLAWAAVPGAAYYRLERALVKPESTDDGPRWTEPEEGAFEIIAPFVYGAAYNDQILTNPALDSPEYQNRYYYRLSAFNPAGGYEESNPTEPVWGMLFSPPVNVKASGGTAIEYVDISWDKQEGVAAYEIRRSDTSTGASPYLLDTVRGNQNWYRNKIAEVEQGRDFYYMVTAVNSFGNKSLQTKPAYGYAKVFGAPDTPETVELDEGSGRGNSKSEIKIKWSECDGAEYYAVYRYSSIDSSLTRLTENTANPFWADSQGLRPGIYYYYQVQSIKNDIITGKVLKSEMSSAEKAPEGFLLSPPATVVAEKNASSGAIRLKWLPAIGGDGERGNYTYKVYADNSLEGNYADCVLSGIAPAADAEGYISTDGDALAGKTFFKIATVNGALESAKGGAVSPVPAAAEIIDASQHALIAGSPAANSNGVYPVRITWKKPANEVPAFYHVQRSSSAGSGFSQINSEALGANGPWNADYSYDEASGVYTYLDRNASAKAGKKYFYRVLSLNQLGQGNFPSAEKVGYGALTHTQYMLEYNKTMKAALKKLTYMHKPGSTEKLGTETKNGTLGGTIYYNAAIAGLGARIIIEVKDYAEFYIENDASRGQYFVLTGNSNTSANMSSNGTMDGTVTCTGMYPGKISYDRIEIKGGAAGGGTYGVTPDGFPEDSVDWKVGNQ